MRERAGQLNEPQINSNLLVIDVVGEFPLGEESIRHGSSLSLSLCSAFRFWGGGGVGAGGGKACWLFFSCFFSLLAFSPLAFFPCWLFFFLFLFFPGVLTSLAALRSSKCLLITALASPR